ncbi:MULTISPECIES: MobC family plasmid mobilization relaxosome protein [Streptomyces]|uniref:Plasmid mobilization relaxosome protein MobC n=1 Tax=Streptomyces tsukubensis (strain DSM 42081 / NBRC 108919 / NRRL 18488 / 9993) TaxID=1114943 RepID=A0A7G3UG93_STRT9|nr:MULTISPECIES: MobC family plasmid mobilization relaxosome protein [Streptomyces]MYS66665.1 plasmid mobilization relaxosome protein MobC [Streptomyces sp. SID5473]QKM68415.1 plasmid mobilization relaxosome protein MobC [Streptomyces tsukubensis NRRL18488]TAI43232.1 MobC family plasmid mobilization relaxosome protein [Streptomyces tsukubensis]
MHVQHSERTIDQQETTTPTATGAARYGVGPSKGRSNANSSAPGVAEVLGHQGVPEEEKAVDDGGAATLRRVARRRDREEVQRKERVDVRYSAEEKARIVGKARELEIAGAHFVGAVVMAYLDGELASGLSGQRTSLDDRLDRLDALRTEVARIGNNVNQIARRLNTGGVPHPGDTALLDRAQQTLGTVRATIAEVAGVMNETVSGKAAG